MLSEEGPVLGFVGDGCVDECTLCDVVVDVADAFTEEVFDEAAAVAVDVFGDAAAVVFVETAAVAVDVFVGAPTDPDTTCRLTHGNLVPVGVPTLTTEVVGGDDTLVRVLA